MDAAKAENQATKRDYLPKLRLDVGSTWGDDVLGIDGRDNEQHALVVLSWTPVGGGGNIALEKRATALERKASELLRAADIQRGYLIRNLWMEMDGSRASMGSLEAYSNKLDKVASDYEGQFNLGKRELIQILDIKSEKYSAKSRLIDARYNETTSSFRILGVQGQLVTWLHGVGGKEPVTEVSKAR